MKYSIIILISALIYTSFGSAYASNLGTQAPIAVQHSTGKSVKKKPKITRVKARKTHTSNTHTVQTVTSTKTNSEMNMIEVLESSGDFSVFIELTKHANLYDGLSNKGPFTLFAPNNAAFQKIPKSTMDVLKKDPEFLKHILKYHVLGAELAKKDMSQYTNALTAQGSKVQIDATDAQNPTIDGAKILQADLKSKNGIIHVIDSVLMPPIHQ